MGNILLRIQEITTNEGINITSMERIIGASKGVLSRAIKQGTDIQSKWLKAIVENYPRYSPLWLLTGEGSMFREEVKAEEPQPVQSKPEESLLRDMFQSLQEEKKEKEKKIEKLTEELRAMERKVGKLEAELEHAAALGSRTADNASTVRRSSQSRASAHSASAHSNE